MQTKNPFQVGNGLRKSKGAVWPRHDQFRLGARKMRTPIVHHTVRTVRGIATTAVANDRVVRNGDRRRIEGAKNRVSRGKTVDPTR